MGGEPAAGPIWQLSGEGGGGESALCESEAPGPLLGCVLFQPLCVEPGATWPRVLCIVSGFILMRLQPPCTDEAQRGTVTCRRSHSYREAEVGWAQACDGQVCAQTPVWHCLFGQRFTAFRGLGRSSWQVGGGGLSFTLPHLVCTLGTKASSRTAPAGSWMRPASRRSTSNSSHLETPPSSPRSFSTSLTKTR